MGAPMYGQSFAVVEGGGSGLGAPAYAGGEAGDETRARGFLAFYEVPRSFIDLKKIKTNGTFHPSQLFLRSSQVQ